ncbi:MAG: hypothetical protein NTV52_02480 [Acidobacteria bacterium]|nr:hypothetical protein [Acidobacteriota bacterium]
MLGNTLFYAEADELLNIVDRLAALMADAGVPHELVGGMAVFLHVRAVSEENARLTSSSTLPNEKPKAQSISSSPAKRFGPTISSRYPN